MPIHSRSRKKIMELFTIRRDTRWNCLRTWKQVFTNSWMTGLHLVFYEKSVVCRAPLLWETVVHFHKIPCGAITGVRLENQESMMVIIMFFLTNCVIWLKILSSVYNCLDCAVVIFLILIWYYSRDFTKSLSTTLTSEEEFILGTGRGERVG